MWLLLKLLFLCFLCVSQTISDVSKNIDVLTINLFDNLRADLKLITNERNTEFIDQQLRNYKNIISKVKENAFRSKRSLDSTSNDNYLDVFVYKNVPRPINGSRDEMKIFVDQKDNCLYGIGVDLGQLKVFKLQNEEFQEIAAIKSHPGSVELFKSLNRTIVILINQKITLYDFFEDQLTEFQRFEEESVYDIKLWNHEDQLYMALLTKSNIQIYQWREKYFDSIQKIHLDDQFGKIFPFAIKTDQFLAFCNNQSADHFKTYSDIFKLNLDSEKYEIFQKIATKSCRDISVFESGSNEQFLLITNGGNDFLGHTIIYQYIERYFIPFQNIKMTQWHSIKIKENSLLIAGNSLENLKGFYYDQWHFMELPINHPFNDSNNFQVLEYDKKSFLVTFDQKWIFFEIKLIKKEKPRPNWLNWCQNHLDQLEKDSEVDVLVGKPSRGDIEVDEMDEALQKLQSESFTNFGNNEMDPNEFEDIMKTIKNYKKSIEEIKENLDESLQSNIDHIFDDLSSKKIVFNQKSFINNLKTTSINSFDINKILNMKININDGFSIDHDPLEFDFVRLEGSHSFQNINNRSIKDLLNLQDKEIGDLIVNGLTTVESIKSRSINDKSIDQETIFLTNHDQEFSTFNLESLKVDKLNFNFFNGMDMSKINTINEKKSISHIEEIKVPRVFVGGFINQVDMQTLDEFTLRTNGDQEILATWFFDHLKANNLQSNDLSGENLRENLILINNGSFKINKDVRFTKDMTVDQLVATEFLGSIPVKDNKLEILKKSTDDTQYVPGLKKINHIKLLNPIKLKGKIRSKDLDSVNPIRTVEDDLELPGSFHVSGNVQILDFLNVKDINASSDQLSLINLIKNGLELKEKTIKNHLHFIQQLNVKNVNVEQTINGIDPKSWVINGLDQDQIIKGSKIVEGDLLISGNTDILSINNIRIPDLESSIFNQAGDQLISGKMQVKFIDSPKVLSNNTFLNNKPWKNVLTSNSDQLNDSTIVILNKDQLFIPEINTESIQVFDHINELNFSKIFNDAVQISNRTISGRKHFNNLKVKNLFVDQGIDLENALKTLHPDVRIQIKDLILNEEVDVENLIFENTFNKMNNLEFKDFVKKQDQFTKSILDQQEFDSIIVYGPINILSGSINNISIKSIEEDTVKIDEPFHFENAVFDQYISADQILNSGQIENLDLDNVFQNNSTEEQTINGEITFTELDVNGTILIKDLINQKNAFEICQFTSKDRDIPQETIITGNVIFAKDPHFYKLNDVLQSDLIDNTWIKDQETTIKSPIKFSKVEFLKDLQINGFLNDIIPQYLADNYVSKSSDDHLIQSNLYFQDTLKANFVSTPRIQTKFVNGIDLKDFTNKILLNDIDQLFEDVLFLEECSIENLNGDFLVNDLSLDQDIMRYSQENLITGSKIINNLIVDQLRLSNSSTVNDIEILRWLENVVLKTSDHQIAGIKTFSNLAVKNGVNLQSNSLNGNLFNNKTIMLRDSDQKILGRKSFLNRVQFDSIKHRGLINGISIGDLVDRLAFKNQDNQFKSQMIFNNTIATNNLSIKKKIQGTKVSKLLSKLINLDALNNFMESYENLYDMSQIVKSSLKGKMHMLSYLKPILRLNGIQKILTVQNANELLMSHNANGTLLLSKYVWDEDQKMFYKKDFDLNLGPYPFYINKITFNDQSHIYLENLLINPQDVPYNGRILTFNQRRNMFDELTNFPSNGSNFVTTFKLVKLSTECLLSAGAFETKILCRQGNNLQIYQRIPVSNVFMASVVESDNTPYIVLIRNGDVKGPNDEATTSIWKFNNKNSLFGPHQEFYEEGVVSLAVTKHFNEIYLALAYTYPSNTKLGKIIITRFDKNTEQFEQWQILHTNHSPTAIELVAVNDQLILIMLTKKALILFNYEGISGFKESLIYNNILPGAFNMNWFSLVNNKYFIGVQKDDEIDIIQAVFK